MAKFAQKEKKGYEERKEHFREPMEDQMHALIMMLAIAENSFKGIQDMLERKGEELSGIESKEKEVELTPSEQSKLAEKEEKRTFTIFYINPGYEEPKVEKIESSVEVKFSTIGEEKMNEALGAKNPSPGIEYIVYPMIQELYSKDAIQEIKELEKSTPIKGSEEAELIDKFVVATPERIMAAVERREKSQKVIEDMIVKIESATEQLKKGESVEKILPVLPPITRKMLEALLKKKKKIDKKIILGLLLSDKTFLGRMKEMLRSLDAKTLDRIAKTIAEGIIKEIKKG